MSKIITASKLNRLWKNGILPIKQDVDNHKTETDKALTNINTALDVMEEKVDGVVENGSGSKIFCTCTGDNAVGTVLTGTLNGKTYTATIGTDGIATFIVSDCGTFVISGTEEYSVSATVVMEYFGIYRIELSSASLDSWIEAGGLNPSSYENLDDLLEDEAAVRTLMTKTAAVDILAQLSASNLEAIINHRYAAKWINYREYAYNTLSAKPEIKALMDETGMYGMYITTESKSQPLVPKLTSNTGSDGGEASAVSAHSSNSVWKAFDGDVNTYWSASKEVQPNGSNTGYIQYKFTKPTVVNKVSFVFGVRSKISNIQISGSYDNNNFVPIKEFDTEFIGDGATDNILDLRENETAYMYIRITLTHTYTGTYTAYLPSLNSLQFYGYQLEALIPTLTSNAGSNGEALYDSINSSDYAYNAFDGSTSTIWSSTDGTGYIGYHFNDKIAVKAVYLYQAIQTGTNYRCGECIVQASHDGNLWGDLTETISIGSSLEGYIILDNTVEYEYYRLYILNAADNNNRVGIASLQFYGEPTLWQPKGLVPVMTSNTAPYGEVIYSTQHTTGSYLPWHAFNGDLISNWINDVNTTAPHWIGYKFANPTMISRLTVASLRRSSGTRLKDFIVQGSNDGSTWDDLSETLTFPQGTSSSAINVTESFDISNSESYLYYRIKTMSESGDTQSTNTFAIVTLQFYGRQLEALVPPMTSNTAPIGEVSSGSEYNSDYAAWKAFDGDIKFHNDYIKNRYGWIPASNSVISSNAYAQYKFEKPVLLNGIAIEYRTNASDSSYYVVFELLGSNDGNDWISLAKELKCTINTAAIYNVDNGIAYKYYRMLITSHSGTITSGNGYKFQFYGAPDYESRTYIYDHGVEVMPVTVYAQSTANIARKDSDKI